MAMSVVYSNFCGMVVSSPRGGVESDYVQDTLGSTIGLMDSAGALTDRWEYWPYGEVVSRTGTNPTPLTFLGVIGYFQDVLSKLLYVRARHLRVDLARWLTVDRFWPMLPPYGYVKSAPTFYSDPTGNAPGDGGPTGTDASLYDAFQRCMDDNDDTEHLNDCCDQANTKCRDDCFAALTSADHQIDVLIFLDLAACALLVVPFLIFLCVAAVAAAAVLGYQIADDNYANCLAGCAARRATCRQGKNHIGTTSGYS